MEDFLAWLTKFNASTVITILALILLIVSFIRIKFIKDIFLWISNKKTARTCGDCILILFGIREKYESESLREEKNILRSQMSYFEQKSHEITQWLIQSFQNDLNRLGKDKPQALKISQLGNYQEALKNSMVMVKDEVRRSFKENGLANMDEIEFSNYIKSKVKNLICTSQTYLSTFYFQTSQTIVDLKTRYENLDVAKVTEYAFDIFGNARTIARETLEREVLLKENFKKEIDSFISDSRNH